MYEASKGFGKASAMSSMNDEKRKSRQANVAVDVKSQTTTVKTLLNAISAQMGSEPGFLMRTVFDAYECISTEDARGKLEDLGLSSYLSRVDELLNSLDSPNEDEPQESGTVAIDIFDDDELPEQPDAASPSGNAAKSDSYKGGNDGGDVETSWADEYDPLDDPNASPISDLNLLDDLFGDKPRKRKYTTFVECDFDEDVEGELEDE
jgi:hypothetical protein